MIGSYATDHPGPFVCSQCRGATEYGKRVQFWSAVKLIALHSDGDCIAAYNVIEHVKYGELAQEIR